MIGLETWQRDASILAQAGDAELEPLNEKALLELVRDALLHESTDAPVRAKWVYARWKPRISLTTGWEVEFADGTVEVVGMKQYCGSKARNLVARRELQLASEGRLRSHALLPERGLHLWSFPYDRMLPGLERLVDMRRTRRLIDDSGLYTPLLMRPGPSVLTPLRYKPERRGVFRLDLRLRPEGGGPRSKECVAIRVLPIADAKRVAANRHTCALAGGAELFPQLLHAEERTGILIEQWLDIEAPERRDFSHASETGELLARLHALPATGTCQVAMPRGSDLFDWHSGLAAASAATYESEPTRIAWTHGDLHPEQLAPIGDSWQFLDLDNLAPGDPYTDLATWIADELTEDDSRDFSSAANDLLATYGAVEQRQLANKVAAEIRARAAGALRRLQLGAVDTALHWLARASDVAPKSHFVGLDVGLEYAARKLAPFSLEQAVERVEVDSKQSLIVTADTPDGLRWFQRKEGSSIEIFPANDDRLPLVSSTRFQADRVISWRSGRRIVLREETGFLKGYRKSRFEGVVARHRRALEEQREQGFRVPRLMEETPELACVTFEPIKGLPILEAGNVPKAFESAGRKLRLLQEGDTNGLSCHDHLDELGVLDALAARITAICGEPDQEWFELRTRLEEKLPCQSRLVFAHRDLHDGQFIWSQDQISLLDFDLLCAADECLDGANLCAHLELRTLQEPENFDRKDATSSRQAFLAGYSGATEDGFEARFAFYETATYLRLALLYGLRPRWTSLVPALLAAARELSRA